MMKTIPILSFFFFATSIFAQNFSKKLSDNFTQETCNCLTKKNSDAMLVVNDCVNEWFMGNAPKFEPYIDFNSKLNPQEQFEKVVIEFVSSNRENLFISCQAISQSFEEMRNKLFEEVKLEYADLDLDEINNNIAIDQNSVTLYMVRGDVHFYNKNWDDAEKDYLNALKLNSEIKDAHYKLGLINEEKGNYDIAITYYQQVIQLTQDDMYLNDVYLAKKKKLSQKE